MPTSPQVGIYFNIMSNRRLFVEKRARFNVEAESLLAEGTTSEGLGLAIMNRLRKASGFNSLKV